MYIRYSAANNRFFFFGVLQMLPTSPDQKRSVCVGLRSYTPLQGQSDLPAACRVRIYKETYEVKTYAKFDKAKTTDRHAAALVGIKVTLSGL